mmetsp:Transcript_51631/g.167712  ORF Transcript_51631/g.167712 Transcript_51631/m.167712 type:complete len:263 (+) Transcript_51631:470-1258(+)
MGLCVDGSLAWLRVVGQLCMHAVVMRVPRRRGCVRPRGARRTSRDRRRCFVQPCGIGQACSHAAFVRKQRRRGCVRLGEARRSSLETQRSFDQGCAHAVFMRGQRWRCCTRLRGARGKMLDRRRCLGQREPLRWLRRGARVGRTRRETSCSCNLFKGSLHVVLGLRLPPGLLPTRGGGASSGAVGPTAGDLHEPQPQMGQHGIALHSRARACGRLGTALVCVGLALAAVRPKVGGFRVAERPPGVTADAGAGPEESHPQGLL